MNNIPEFLFKLSIMLVPGIFAVVCHEVSHGYIAYKLGDSTAKSMGRLTLNPIKHIDPIGLLMLFIIKIGWAKPVPVNFNNLRNPKRDMIWVAAAGPITNLLLATVSAILIRSIIAIFSHIPIYFSEPMLLMLVFSVFINLVLAIFNLIPVPPLDGGRVIVGLLPHHLAMAYSRVEPFGMIGIILIVILFPSILSMVILPPLNVGILFLIGPDALDFLIKNTSIIRLGFLQF
jgi:Zn-dependent protease